MNDTTPRLNFGRVAIAPPPDEKPPATKAANSSAPAMRLDIPTPVPRPRPAQQHAVPPAATDDFNPMLNELDDEVTPSDDSEARSVPEPKPPMSKQPARRGEVTKAVAPSPVELPKRVRRRTLQRQSRFLLTVEHLELLRWIEKARYTSNEQVAVFMDKDLRWTRKTLGKLQGHGYVKRKQYAGYPTAYFLTAAAKDLLGSDTRAVDEDTGPGFIRHTLDVAWVMLGFLKSQVEWAATAERILGRAVELDDFISESEVSRSANKRFGEVMTNLERHAKRSGQKTFVKKWEGWDALREEAGRAGAADELDESNLYLFAAFGTSNKPHYPDLVLRLPRDPTTSRPRSLAIEVERSHKPASVDGILNSYSTATSTSFGNYLWLCGDRRVRELVASKVQARGLRAHAVQLSNAAKQWKAAYLATLEANAAEVRAVNAAARSKGYWHVTSDLKAVECRCGETCRARHGRFISQGSALDLLDELM